VFFSKFSHKKFFSRVSPGVVRRRQLKQVITLQRRWLDAALGDTNPSNGTVVNILQLFLILVTVNFYYELFIWPHVSKIKSFTDTHW